MPKKSAKQMWEECYALIETGEQAKIEEAFANAEEQKFNLLKKLDPWIAVVGELTVENLTNFFSTKSLTMDNEFDKKQVKLYYHIEELILGEEVKVAKAFTKFANLKRLVTSEVKGKLPVMPADFDSLEELVVESIIPKDEAEYQTILDLKESIIFKKISFVNGRFSINEKLVEELKTVPHLTGVAIHKCYIRDGRLPVPFRDLNLETISLTQVDLKSLPNVLYDMKNLKELDLSGNELCEVPKEIQNYPLLEYERGTELSHKAELQDYFHTLELVKHVSYVLL